MTTLNDLADRVERATEPSRELDAEIALAMGWRRYRPESSDLRHAEIWHDASGAPRQYLPRFTASIDDALGLVPEGAFWNVLTDGDRAGLFQATVVTPATAYRKKIDYREAAAPALALCAAALRARAAAAGGERG